MAAWLEHLLKRNLEYPKTAMKNKIIPSKGKSLPRITFPAGNNINATFRIAKNSFFQGCCIFQRRSELSAIELAGANENGFKGSR